LQDFLSAKTALVQHRQALLKRLDEIDAALRLVAPRSTRTYGPRPNNEMTLPGAIAKVTAKSPLTIREIVEAVVQAGYKFSSANPINSVGVYLYGPGKKLFKRKAGKFSPGE
jgi:hypothetical protein